MGRRDIWNFLRRDDADGLRAYLGDRDARLLRGPALWNPARPARFKTYQGLLEVAAGNRSLGAGAEKCVRFLVDAWDWDEADREWAAKRAARLGRHSIVAILRRE